MNRQLLAQLEQTLHRQMPICAAMHISLVNGSLVNGSMANGTGPLQALHKGGSLAMAMPLAPNRNHQETAFAGSLNALCTVVGWGTMFLLMGERKLQGNIVIHRSAIRYRRPVQTVKIVARALPLSVDSIDYFFELLESKGISKLEVVVEIAGIESMEHENTGHESTLVSFKGSYVVDMSP